MTLTRPDFRLTIPNARALNTTDAVWGMSRRMLQREPSTRDGGTYADKPGYHNKGSQVRDAGVGSRDTDYSIRDAVDRTGPWWRGMSSAWDWTFTTAQAGDYTLIDRYTSRLVRSAMDPNDPRLDMSIREFYGQADTDTHVEGWDERRDVAVTSDSSHLWHIHTSFRRDKVGDVWAIWAYETVLLGASVAEWRATLPVSTPVPAPAPVVPAGIPTVRAGSRVLWFDAATNKPNPKLRGTDVAYVQRWIGPTRMGPADGIAGARFSDGVRWYQRMRGLTADGKVGQRTWAAMGVRWTG